MDKLADFDLENLKLEDYRFVYDAKITHVVDGDTVDLHVDRGFYDSFEDRFRLFGINTKELHSKIAEDRQLAQEAKDYVTMLLNVSIMIRSVKDKREKFGRWFAIIFYKKDNVWTNLNKELLAKNYAVEYYGEGSAK